MVTPTAFSVKMRGGVRIRLQPAPTIHRHMVRIVAERLVNTNQARREAIK
ncbi:MAG: hypothetical protein J5I90_06500 [Caldilineales bacterium]|nr:hypothetical protein [Caldilineales bacterium]